MWEVVSSHSLDGRLQAVLVAIVASLLAAGCQISPVVSTSEPTARYGDCERAAEAYCQEVVQASGPEVNKCVAEYRFKCVAGLSE